MGSLIPVDQRSLASDLSHHRSSSETRLDARVPEPDQRCPRPISAAPPVANAARSTGRGGMLGEGVERHAVTGGGGNCVAAQQRVVGASHPVEQFGGEAVARAGAGRVVG